MPVPPPFPPVDAPLELHGLACRRAGRLVFKDVSLRVAPGQAAVLRGPNGAGKSSLIRILAGLLPPAAGDARMGALSLRADPEGWRARVALAGHLDAVKPALSVRQNLLTWARLFGLRGAAARAAADGALERFDLARLADEPAHYCSAGQKRRLGLARLLVARRPLWLLDEPTVSLDARNAAEFARAVAEHCAAGGLAVAATHVEMGLPDGPVAVIAPHAPGGGEGPDASAAGDDPFLTGAWE
ncbi:heme ABC exporter ATP-binding protein CcmA [Oceanicella actignis]|uniref:heme ABC exporter ATP-binding protein CcmA n=1 Tax=Oceanicella actignis TaxID=1189325 RepID=UPI0011E66B17|nr:heme ABC exporter ATP-binding protein CcmA [Oceanicella actignis]TYO90779.1 heme exporter protein A [Oceanicella actignis]